MNNDVTIKILMIAAEPSADKLGASLIEGIVTELKGNRKVLFQGIG